MSDTFLRANFASDALPANPTASDLLDWAEQTATRATPQNVYRNREGRKTLRFELSGDSFFLKLHTGIGWREIFKNLLQAKLPVVSAENEYRALLSLQQAQVETMTLAAFSRVGGNPARRRSMLVTDDLVDTVSLEQHCAHWAAKPPSFSERQRLLRQLAVTAKRMHDAGVNHRDFYLCHFHLDVSSLSGSHLRCYLIDLHRAQLRRYTPRRWIVKDLAALYFSAMNCGLTRRDLQRFAYYYHGGGLRGQGSNRQQLWRDVEKRARRLYLKEHGEAPPALAAKNWWLHHAQ